MNGYWVMLSNNAVLFLTNSNLPLVVSKTFYEDDVFGSKM